MYLALSLLRVYGASSVVGISLKANNMEASEDGCR